MIFTTSWDDGYALDLRTADMLARHGMRGTFYVCPKPLMNQRMLTGPQLRELSTHFEIGAHSMTHPHLPKISREEARKELAESKKWIEELTDAACTMFCYPKGEHNESTERLAAEAGFVGARTTEELRFEKGENPFALPTTLQVYPFPLRRKWLRRSDLLDPLPRLRKQWKRLRQLRIPVSALRSWRTLADALFETAVRTSLPAFHLWGHAYELEHFRLWDELDGFLRQVAGTPGIRFLTNGEWVADASDTMRP